MRRTPLLVLPFILPGAIAFGQLDLGSDGSDGHFTFVPDGGTGNTMTIDLRLAVNAAWNTPSPVPGRGVYDGEKWAVVFKYSTIIIPAGRTIQFRNHNPNAPVIWLATGTVEIRGAINLNGAIGNRYQEPVTFAEGGPGGFRGGRSSGLSGINNSGGFGPGGAPLPAIRAHGTGGTYGTKGRLSNPAILSPAPTYGNQAILPLMGGSGGSAGRSTTFEACDAGGGGGGAILIGSNTTLTLFTGGSIQANGGRGGADHLQGGGGSGGAIKLIADVLSVQSQALIRSMGGFGSSGGNGGLGRVRLEANTLDVNSGSEPPMTSAAPGAVFPEPDSPFVRLASVDNQVAPEDPFAGLYASGIDLRLTNTNPVPVVIEATNVPVTPMPAIVSLRVQLSTGDVMSIPATFTSGDNAQSTWTASVPFAQGVTAVQAMVDLP